MATKLYLPSGAGSGLPTISGSTPSWNNTGAVESAQRMSTTKQSTTMTTTGQKYGDANSGFQTHLIKRFISKPVTAQTISGDVQLQLRCAESSTSLNATLAIAVYRINSSGAYQDTLLSVSYSDSSSSPYEMATSLTNRRAHDVNEDYTIPLTSRTFSAGDMIVVEVGFAESNTSTSRYATFSFGDDSSTDLGDNTTDTSAYNPWVQFSQTITFQTNVVSATTKSRNLIPDKNVANGAESGTVTGLTKYYTNGSPIIAADASNAYAGSYGIKLNNNGDADGGGLRLDDATLVPVTVGTNYVTSFYSKNPSATGWIALIWYNSSKTELSYTNTSWAASSSYQRREISQQAPANAAYASFYADNGDLSVDGWIDNIQLEEGTTASTYVDPGLPGAVLSGSATGTTIRIITATASGGASLSSTTASATRVFKGTTSVASPNVLDSNQATAGDTLNNTTGFSGINGASVSVDSVNYYQGEKSIKVTTANQSYTGAKTTTVAITGGGYFTGRFRLKAPSGSGNMYAQLLTNVTGQVNFKDIGAPTGAWQEVKFDTSGEYVQSSGSDTTIYVQIAYYSAPGVIDFNWDELEIEGGQTVHDWTPPGNISSGGVLSGTAEATLDTAQIGDASGASALSSSVATASVTRKVDASAAAALTTSNTPDLIRVVNASAGSSLTTSNTPDLIRAASATASAALSSTTATASVLKVITATASGAAALTNTTAVQDVTVKLTATAGSSLTTSAVQDVTVKLSASAGSSLTTSNTPKVTRVVAASAAIQSVATSVASRIFKATSTAAATLASTTANTKVTYKASATAAALSGATATIKRTMKADASANGSLSTSNTPKLIMDADAIGGSAISATVSSKVTRLASSVGDFVLSGSAEGTRIAGSATVTAEGNAYLTTSAIANVDWDATATATAVTAATVTAKRLMSVYSNAISGLTSVQAVPDLIRKASATAAAALSTNNQPKVIRTVSATSGGTLTTTASVIRVFTVVASAASALTTTAAGKRTLTTTLSGSGVSGGSAVTNTIMDGTASGDAISNGIASLTQVIISAASGLATLLGTAIASLLSKGEITLVFSVGSPTTTCEDENSTPRTTCTALQPYMIITEG